jgi:hypothetical protein
MHEIRSTYDMYILRAMLVRQGECWRGAQNHADQMYGTREAHTPGSIREVSSNRAQAWNRAQYRFIGIYVLGKMHMMQVLIGKRGCKEQASLQEI